MNVHVTVSLALDQLKDFDVWWKANNFKSRSDALAYLIRTVVPTKATDDPF